MVKTINRLSLIVKALLNRGLDLDFLALDILPVLIVASIGTFTYCTATILTTYRI